MTAVHEISSDVEELQEERLSPPNREDMHHLAYLLANMTDHLDTAPEVALTIVSQEMGWLFSKDVPRFTLNLCLCY